MAGPPKDWEALRLAFIIDPNRPTLENFCGTHELSLSTAKKRSAAEGWMELRNHHWNRVGTKASGIVEDLQAAVVARDTSQQLADIQAMKATALRYAGGMDGHAVAYEKPHEAVAAYERLVKLERLILGESTEHIRVDDAREMVRAVIQVIREEVRDLDTATRIVHRLEHLGPAERSGADPDRPARA